MPSDLGIMDLSILTIDLKEIKESKLALEYEFDSSYFDAINAQDIHKGSIHLNIDIMRAAHDYFIFDFSINGTVIVNCDLCLEEMEQPVITKQRIEVKLGVDSSEQNDIIMVDEREAKIDVSWYIYEFIVLALPIKHVHKPGKCNPAMMRVLNNYSADRSGENAKATIDPRWEILSKLNK